MADQQPVVARTSRISPLWLLPAIALAAGVWMVVQSYLTQGPVITIEFQTAEGLVEGTTRVKMLNVDMGVVETVRLKRDVSGVVATVSLDREAAPLLREDTQFWVVRARLGVGGVSGIGTLLSGAYIEFAPGSGRPGSRRFVGLDIPPYTPVGAPGKRFRLLSERAAIRPGDSVLYHGFKVGRVEAMSFDTATSMAGYDIFVDAPYDELVDINTRFWDISGVSHWMHRQKVFAWKSGRWIRCCWGGWPLIARLSSLEGTMRNRAMSSSFMNLITTFSKAPSASAPIT